MTNGIFLFRFQNKRDLEFVVGNRPWHFKKHLFILWELDGSASFTIDSLCKASFWILIYNLPLQQQTPDVVRVVGAQLGVV